MQNGKKKRNSERQPQEADNGEKKVREGKERDDPSRVRDWTAEGEAFLHN